LIEATIAAAAAAAVNIIVQYTGLARIDMHHFFLDARLYVDKHSRECEKEKKNNI